MLLYETLRNHLRSHAQCALPIVHPDNSPHIYCRLPVNNLRADSVSVAMSRPLLHSFDPEGPLVRFLFLVYSSKGKSHIIDTWINPTCQIGHEVLVGLSEFNEVQFHIFGADSSVPYCGTKGLYWTPQHCREADRILEQTKFMK